jgi:AcrR family transcriptional regulator
MGDQRARGAASNNAVPCELRGKIIDASVALIEELGLAKLSMREVARRAGVTHQAPYHHFADREAILGEIAEQGFRLLGAEIERVSCEVCTAHKPVTALITAMGQAYVEFACQHPAHFRIMFRPELVNLDKCPEARKQGDFAFDKLTRAVHQAVANGLPAVPSEAAVVALCWSVGHGLACLLLDGPLAQLPCETRAVQIRDVAAAFGALLDASVAQCPKAR